MRLMLECGVWRRPVPVPLRRPLASLFLTLLIVVSAHGKKRKTGFLDRTVTVQGTAYKYQVFVPDAWTPQQKWPIILFLHGAGERGDDGLLQTDVGIATAIRNDRGRFPAVIVMPQCRENVWWIQSPMDDLAIAALEAATKEFHGDTQRTYLTGLSMGGYGTWHLAGKYPGRFAALIAICGGIRPPEKTLRELPELAKFAQPDDPKTYSDAAAKVGKTPVWIFHGSDDDTVPVVESQRMNAAMKALGGEVHYTEYPGVGHESWNKAYAEPDLFTWLLSKSLNTNRK